jgi:pyridoxamine 5'-phosphate oxidase
MRPGSWHSVYHPIKGGHPAKQKAEHVITDPYARFGAWFAEAKTTEPNDPNAMILATAAPNPSARTVLLKAWDERGFVFYTNLESRKSNALASNPHAALLFYWKILHRQVRIEGVVALVEAHEADAYFATRPRDSQAGAWASAQSKPLPDRETFETRLTDIKARYEGRTSSTGCTTGKPIAGRRTGGRQGCCIHDPAHAHERSILIPYPNAAAGGH